MPLKRATAIAPANIAFVKYWGVRDVERTLPYNGSISMNLDSCLTTTTVTFDSALAQDEVTLTLYGGEAQHTGGRPLERVVTHLDRMRALAGVAWRARVESSNNFPSDAGIASSAAAFAALTLAGVAAPDLPLFEGELSIFPPRSHPGSACPPVPPRLFAGEYPPAPCAPPRLVA